MFAKICGILILFALATPAFAKAPIAQPRFTDTVIYAEGPSVGIAYFTVESPFPDVIDGLGSDCCEAVELHSNVRQNGVMRMRKAGGLEVPAKRAVHVQPPERGGDAASGLHVMLIGLKQPLTAGEKVAITVNFKHAKSQMVVFTVVDRRVTSATPTAEHAHH
ncbi:MAG: copper chaperone PCu(A)C [Rickettsiales bacterium]